VEIPEATTPLGGNSPSPSVTPTATPRPSATVTPTVTASPTPAAASQAEEEIVIADDLVARGAPSPQASPSPSPAQSEEAGEELILEDAVPLGTLPQTGETSRVPYLFAGFLMLISGLGIIRTRKSK
jgi:LPXTG-motif cell wall-anchored protein